MKSISHIDSDSNHSYLTDIYHIWLVSSDGEVLVKSPNKNTAFRIELKVKDVTLEGNNKDDLLNQIESSWGIKCNPDHLIPLCEYKNAFVDQNFNEFILCVKLDEESKSSISNRFGGKFYNYQNLEDVFYFYDKTYEFKECFFTVLENLDNKFIRQVVFKEQSLSLVKK